VILFIASLLFFAQSAAAEITLEDLATPDSAEEWFLVGNFFFDVGEYSDAIGSWHNAMILDPTFAADAWYNIGLAYAYAQLYQDAILAWLYSLELNPSSAASYDNMATAYFILGMPKEAFMAYDLAVAIEPMETKYAEDRKIFIENLKNIASDVEDNAFQIEQWNDIGLILYHEGKIVDAQRAWEKAVMPSHATEPTTIAKIWKNIAIAHMEQEDYTSAMNAWQSSIEFHPDGSAYNDLGYCYIMLNMPKKALYAFECALTLEPENELFSDNKNNLLKLFPEILDEELE
jgi:tetratricopeptide (TPR) repeat protein